MHRFVKLELEFVREDDLERNSLIDNKGNDGEAELGNRELALSERRTRQTQ